MHLIKIKKDTIKKLILVNLCRRPRKMESSTCTVPSSGYAVCEEVKPGGISSKQVSRASVHELPEPWEQLGKFVLLMDMATRYKVTEVLFETKHGEIKVKSANDMVRVVTLRWLADKPRPKWIIPDNAKSLTAKRFEEFMGDLGIAVGWWNVESNK